MDGSTTKNKVMIFFIFLMLLYFITIHFLNEVNNVNKNNTYVSINLIFTTKEEYITEYIQYIQDKNYKAAYNMLDDSTKEYFENSLDKFADYAKGKYKNIATKAWKFKFNLKSEEKYKKINIYSYEVLDENKKDNNVIDKIKINEYAVNVFKINLL